MPPMSLLRGGVCSVPVSLCVAWVGPRPGLWAYYSVTIDCKGLLIFPRPCVRLQDFRWAPKSLRPFCGAEEFLAA